jgi:hypothetical protein
VLVHSALGQHQKKPSNIFMLKMEGRLTVQKFQREVVKKASDVAIMVKLATGIQQKIVS